MTLAEIGSFIAVFVSLYAILSQRRYVDAQTSEKVAAVDTSNAKTAMELRAEMKTDRAEYRAEYLKLKSDFDVLVLTLESERKERQAERTAVNEELRSLRGELKERDEIIQEQYVWIGLMQAQLVEHHIAPRYAGRLLNVTQPTLDEKKEMGKP